MAEPQERARRVPPRCRMIHPFVEEATLALLERRAAVLRVAPEQLAAYIIESVIGNARLEQFLKI
jgi:hypothetical protein